MASSHRAYTLVAQGYVPTYEEETDTQGRSYRRGYKWPGGWAFTSEDTAAAARAFLPEAAGVCSVREIELSAPLIRVASRHSDIPGCFLLREFARILPKADKTAKASKPSKPAKPKKPPVAGSLFD